MAAFLVFVTLAAGEYCVPRRITKLSAHPRNQLLVTVTALSLAGLVALAIMGLMGLTF